VADPVRSTGTGAGPVRERYLADPLATPDVTQWRTEITWPLTADGLS
jgi:hypothetical protein